MTDIKLLPLPEGTEAGEYMMDAILFDHSDMTSYARANVAHATAAKDAEIERLRAKLDGARARLEGVGKVTRFEAVRAERLAEALRAVVADMREWGEPAKGAHVERIQRRLDDALRDHDQEGKDG